MTRQKLPNGQWRELGPNTSDVPPAMFEPANPPGEIVRRRVAIPVKPERSEPMATVTKAQPTPRMRQVWDSLLQHEGNLTRTATALGLTAATIRNAALRYMQIEGIPDSKRPWSDRAGPRPVAKVIQPAPDMPSEPEDAAPVDEAPLFRIRPILLPGDGHALPPLVQSAVDWLVEHGSTWTQAQAETWLVLFTRAVDLEYPTAA